MRSGAAAAAAAAAGSDDRTALLGSRRFASYGAHENRACVSEENELAVGEREGEGEGEQKRQQEESSSMKSTASVTPTQSPTQSKKTTLLMRAGCRPQGQLKVEDIFRKGIDIAREFNASEFSGQQKVIQLVVRKNSDGGCAFPDVRVVSGSQAGVQHDDVVIDMPEEADGSWRRRRNLSDSSRAPLISDV